ncbi:hypothetical protein B0H14DRAFT_2571527 [Mycena olivaceomarginata]|nr:hypothetical protein B0H14DRAFT_2571527 [Mycena olivaceomarginata]
MADIADWRARKAWRATSGQSWNGTHFDYYEINPVDGDNTYLADHHRLEMTLDDAVANGYSQMHCLISFLRPKMDLAMRNVAVEYVIAVFMAILGVLTLLPTRRTKFDYLEHQRRYLNGLALVESTFLRDATGTSICMESQRPFTDIYKEALIRISFMLGFISDSVYRPSQTPTDDQLMAARQFGDVLSVWTIGSYRACAVHHRDISAGYFSQVNVLRAALKENASPSNVINYKELEYELYSHDARIALETGSPEVWVKPT